MMDEVYKDLHQHFSTHLSILLAFSEIISKIDIERTKYIVCREAAFPVII